MRSVPKMAAADARTPLHCAGAVAVAALLPESCSPEVARCLLERGAKRYIFLAAALGDMALAEKLINEDRGCLAHRIGKAPEFPPLGQGRSGTIYQWTLRFNSYPHQIALMKGRREMFDFLYAESDTATGLSAC